jgi:hypothetical protein
MQTYSFMIVENEILTKQKYIEIARITVFLKENFKNSIVCVMNLIKFV